MKRTLIGISAIFIAAALCPAVFFDRPAAPSFSGVQGAYRSSRGVLLDRHGAAIHELRTDRSSGRLDWTRLDDMSPALVQTVVASEDRGFYSHGGVDWLSLCRAAAGNMFSRDLRGASTISMQVAALLRSDLHATGGRRTWRQKWLQVRAALELEHAWAKSELLEAYLNLITFRSELQGISAASWGLFRKAPAGLSEREAVILAALVRSPNAPVEDVAKRARLLAGRLQVQAPAAEIDGLVRQSLALPYGAKPPVCLAPHVARRLLKPGVRSAASTLDGGLQEFCAGLLRQAVLALRERHVHDGAVLVVDNPTGEVLAYVANAGDASSASHVDGIRARRQAGSTLKPFLYALAFDRRILTPASLLEDLPLNIPTPRGMYSPENYDKEFRGIVTARTALAASLNAPAVRALVLAGDDAFADALAGLGFTGLREGSYYGPSLALGTADISLLELVNAYRSLAGKGRSSELVFTAGQLKGNPRPVFSEAACFLVNSILSDREARSATFGLENPLSTRYWSAVKTGTSKDMRDNWCVGFSEKYTVGVWVGNFSGEPMRDVSGVTGAAPVWREVMNRLQKDFSGRPPEPPAGVVCRDVLFAEEGVRKKEFFMQGTEPDIVAACESGISAKILYPPDHTVLAFDPDIPAGRQRVFFQASAQGAAVRWKLNGADAGPVRAQKGWLLSRGPQELALVDSSDTVLDRVRFSVR